MKLKWYGQASFLITSENDGTTIITDPYTPETSGYTAVTDEPDIVIISSGNDLFHCRADLIPGDKITVNALELAQNSGNTTEKGVPIHAIEAFEALNHAYHDPDHNAMYKFEVDGMIVGHMGDMGNAFNEVQMEFFKDVDVLLALTGGHPVIELDDLKTVIDTTKPKIVVPMHFRTMSYKPRNMFWIQTFLDYFPDDDVDFAFHYEAQITKESLPEATRVLVIDYVR